MVDASDKLGCRLDTALYYNKQLQEAGFLNVVEHRFKWPMNTWPKDKEAKLLGSWVYENVAGGVEGLSLMLLTNVLGYSVAEVQELLTLVKRDLGNRNIHGYWNVRTLYAQKPE